MFAFQNPCLNTCSFGSTFTWLVLAEQQCGKDHEKNHPAQHAIDVVVSLDLRLRTQLFVDLALRRMSCCRVAYDPVRLDGVLGDFQTAVKNTNGLVSDARFGNGTIATLLNDPTTSAHVKQTAANAEGASANLEQASVQARQVVADFQSRNLPSKVDESVTNVRHASEQIDQASQRVNSTLTQALGPDGTGVTAAQNLQEILSNVNIASGNLAEDTEAIKHEFLFRGFFRKRGYYSLSDLTPDEYRSNRLFNNPRDKRLWLGSDSFTQDANGTVILSGQGQIQVDQIVGTEGDAIMALPIMIEGYSTDPVPYKQILLSTAYSTAVAHYLEKRFKLQSSNLGIISLDAKPSPISGKDSWNGACIVFLSQRK